MDIKNTHGTAQRGGSSRTPALSSRVVIIGNKGRMGRALQEELSLAGLDVSGTDRNGGGPSLRSLVSDGKGHERIILLCVPVGALEQALCDIAPLLDPERDLLMDITSVKALPMRWMQAAYSGPVVGAHPLFGPNPAAEDKKTALVKGEKAEARHCRLAENLFSLLGSAFFWSGAEEHDKGVGFAQSLNFTVSAAFFAALARREGIRPYLTPSFKRHLNAARKHLTEDTAMFLEFTAHNPAYQDILRQYAAILQEAADGNLAQVAEEAAAWYRD